MSCIENIDKTITEQADLYDITVLYQFKGKDFYYNDLFKKDIKSMINDTISREVKAVIEILDVEVSPSRLKNILKNDSEPKTNDEMFVRNIKHIFKTFASNIGMFDIQDNQFLNIAKQLLFGIAKVDFDKVKKVKQTNLVKETIEISKRDILKETLVKFNSLVNNHENELISLIAALYVDFMKIEPFNKYNDLVGLFLLYSVLYREGFNMFKYVSFFEIYNLHKDEFNEAYIKSQINWEKGYANASPLAVVIRKIMIEGYRLVDNKVRAKEIHITNKKTDLVEYNIMYNLPEVFTKEMIRECIPDASRVTIDRTLDRLQKENKIRSNGTGRSATWIRLVEIERFKPEALGQTNLFDFMTDEEKERNEQ